MPHEPLGHHEVDLPRLGRVRLPRVRAVASATTAGVLLCGAAAPLFAGSPPRAVATAPVAEHSCPPWRCNAMAAADGRARGESDPAAPARPARKPAAEPREIVARPRTAPAAAAPDAAPEVTAPDAPSAPVSEAVAHVAPRESAVVPADPVAPPATEPEPAPAPALEPVAPADPAAPPATDPEPAPAPALEPAAPADPVMPPATEPEPAQAPVTDPVAPTEPAPAPAPEASEAATPPEAAPTQPEAPTAAPEPGRGTRIGGEAYRGWGGGAEAAWNDEEAQGGVEVGIGFDSSWNVTPDTEMPATGPFAEASVAAGVPGTNVRGRATVTVDGNGVSGDVQYSTGLGRTSIGTGPEGVETPEARFGGSVPGFTSPVGGHLSVGYRGKLSPAPAPDPAALDSDGDGYTDGSLQESPEVGGRQGMNPAGTARSPLDSDMDGVVDRSDRTIGRDSDEDGVADDIDQKPGEVDVDRDADGVADQFDGEVGETDGDPGAIGTTDSDGDGHSDGSFAESPEMGGRETHADYGNDQSAPASDDTGADADAVGTTDSDGDGHSDGSFAESPEMGGRETHADYGSDAGATAGGI